MIAGAAVRLALRLQLDVRFTHLDSGGNADSRDQNSGTRSQALCSGIP